MFFDYMNKIINLLDRTIKQKKKTQMDSNKN